MVLSAAQSSGATVWQIDPNSTQVEFAVRHLGISTIKGRFNGVRGQISDVPEDRSLASVEIEIDAASLDTGQDERDGHLRSAMFLDAEVYPTIVFRSAQIDVQNGNQLRVAGQLSCHGMMAEIVLDATVNGHAINPITQDRVLGFSATGKLSRSAFGIELPAPFAGTNFVGDDIDIWINVEAVRTAEST